MKKVKLERADTKIGKNKTCIQVEFLLNHWEKIYGIIIIPELREILYETIEMGEKWENENFEMNPEEQIKLIKNLIAVIRKDYISKCEKEKDRDPDCVECRACWTVEFLKEHIRLLKGL